MRILTLCHVIGRHVVGRHVVGRHAAAAVIALGLGALGLGACSFDLPGTGPAPSVYDLTPKSTFEDNLPSVSWQLIVEEPGAARGLDTDRIVIRPSAYQILYIKGVKWSDRAPELVQVLLIESFENTGKIVGVGRRAIGLSGEFVLKSELREFQAERVLVNGAASVQVRVHIILKLVQRRKGVIFASQSFEVVAPAASDATIDLVHAFDDALGSVMKRAVGWTLRTAQSQYETSGMAEGALIE